MNRLIVENKKTDGLDSDGLIGWIFSCVVMSALPGRRFYTHTGHREP